MAQPLSRIEGKYEIVAKISEGGMGAVYKVRHRLLDEIRVVKLLRPHLSDEDDLRTRFSHEARAAIRLRHPNIVQLFDFTLDDDGVGLIVMEHIDGVDLRRLITLTPPPSLRLVLEIARQSLRALGYLHRRGFVHRDVSPDNLMLTRDIDEQPLVKMIDLGIAKHNESQHQLTQSGMFLGKFRYSSPEHFSAEEPNDIEPRSDLYAFGVVLYELLTGVHPIVGDDATSLIGGHLFRPPRAFADTDPDDRIPDALREIVLRAICKPIDDRFESAQAFDQALARVQARLRDESDLDAELGRCLAPAQDGPSPEAAAPGSTQIRLDAGFDLTRTPSPTAIGRERVPPITLVPPDEPSTEAGTDMLPAEASVPEPDHGTSDFDRELADGCRRIAEDDFAGAIAAFERALDASPGNPLISSLLSEARQGLESRTPETAPVEPPAARASDPIPEAPDTQAPSGPAATAIAVGQLLSDGREHLASGRSDDALGALERARALDPDDTWIAEQLEQLHASLAMGPAAAAAFAEIEQLVDRGRLAEAWRQINEAMIEHGEQPPLVDLRQRLAAQIVDG